MVLKHVYISGKVQGVYFRDTIKEQALKLGVNGWIRNLPDGRVEAVFQGEEDKMQKILEWCRQGSPMSRVEDVYVEDISVEDVSGQEYNGFSITG